LPFCHFTLKGCKPLPEAYPTQLETLGDHLRKRRLDLGLLQRQVAEELGIRKGTVYNWESNHRSPQLRFMPRIIEFLGYLSHHAQARTLGEMGDGKASIVSETSNRLGRPCRDKRSSRTPRA